jgi:flagellar basal body-associated protein FliL
MKTSLNQKGFSVVEAVIVVVVLVLIAGAGYFIWDRNKADKNDLNTSTSQEASESATATDVKAAPEIKTSSDLGEAEKVLDATDPEASSADDSSSLDSELSEF